MGIDFGMARIGTALSDPMQMLATGLETLRWNGEDLDWVWERLLTLIKQHEVKALVIGVPKRTDGRGLSETEVRADAFAKELEMRTGLPIHRVDERFTTVIATRHLHESGSKKQRKDVIDQAAAEVILQGFLDGRRPRN